MSMYDRCQEEQRKIYISLQIQRHFATNNISQHSCGCQIEIRGSDITWEIFPKG